MKKEINSIVMWDGDAYTTSNIVAERFGKQHANTLRSIESLIKDAPEFSRLNFEASDYINSRGRKYKQYRITKDGFMMLAMGFTGKDALKWKEVFINAFNKLVDIQSANIKEIDSKSAHLKSETESASSCGRGLRLHGRNKKVLKRQLDDLIDKVQLPLPLP